MIHIAQDVNGEFIDVYEPQYHLKYHDTFNLQPATRGNNFDISTVANSVTTIVKDLHRRFPNASILIEEQVKVNFRGKAKGANLVTVGNCAVQSAFMALCGNSCRSVHPRTWITTANVQSNLTLAQLQQQHHNNEWPFWNQIAPFSALMSVHEYDALFIAIGLFN